MSEVQTSFKRYEKKYLLTKSQYLAVKRGMEQYTIPDAHPRYTICNLYYDTEQYDLVRTSLEKPIYKEKLRLRSYGVPGSRSPVFVEIKKKFDDVVYKRRITMEEREAMPYLQRKRNGDGSQIGREIDWFLKLYRPEPKVFIAYDREAYAAANGSELRPPGSSLRRSRRTAPSGRPDPHGNQDSGHRAAVALASAFEKPDFPCIFFQIRNVL